MTSTSSWTAPERLSGHHEDASPGGGRFAGGAVPHANDSRSEGNQPGSCGIPLRFTTLVRSPITAAGAACHDSTLAINRRTASGGESDAPRGRVLALSASQGQCLPCHGPGRIAAIGEVHQQQRRAVAAGLVDLVITDELEAEYRRAVEYPQVRRQAARVNRKGFADAIVAMAYRVEADSAVGAVPTDPGDDMVVGAALSGRADFLVTLDRHLLDLAGLPGVVILRPGDFLPEIRAQRRLSAHPISGPGGGRRGSRLAP